MVAVVCFHCAYSASPHQPAAAPVLPVIMLVTKCRKLGQVQHGRNRNCVQPDIQSTKVQDHLAGTDTFMGFMGFGKTTKTRLQCARIGVFLQRVLDSDMEFLDHLNHY